MVRRTGWWLAALLVSLAHAHDTGVPGVAFREDGGFIRHHHNQHRELLDFDAAAGRANDVVATVATNAVNAVNDVIDKAVNAFTSGGGGVTPAPSTSAPTPAALQTATPQTTAPETAAPQTTPAPETATPEVTPTSEVTSAPETAAPETAAPAAVDTASPASNTPAPSDGSGSQQTEGETPTPESTGPVAGVGASTEAPETPEPATPEPAASPLDAANSMADETEDPIDNPDASETSGSSSLASFGSNSTTSETEPNLEENVIPASTPSVEPELEENVIPAAATPSPSPTSAAPELEENVIPAAANPSPAPATTVPPVTTAPPSSVIQLPVSDTKGQKKTRAPSPSPSKKPSSDAGQVHAAVPGSISNTAVGGVGKNDGEPASSAPPTRRPRKPKKGELGSGSQAEDESVETNTSSGSVYKIGATSIVSIVGVIVGICAVLLLFVVISRKKYGEESDDELPMAYGYRIDGGSVVRLSPTFLHNGESSMVGGHPSNLDHDNTSSSGESGEEKNVYFGNSMMFDNYQTNMDSGAMAAASYSKQSEGFQSMYSSMASQNSESWSSVLDSDIDQSHTSRNTRDTTLSGLTTTPMHSECGSTRSRLQSGNIRDTYADDVMSDTSSNYRFTGATSVASPLARDTAPQGYDVYAVGNERPTAGSNAAPPRSTAANSFYRTSSIARSSGYSDYLDGDAGRSTGASSIYSVGERVSA